MDKSRLNAVFVWLSLTQLTPIERYALHYLEYLHISDDEAVLKVTSTEKRFFLRD